MLLPFVQGADAHTDELGELGLAESHSIPDGTRIGIGDIEVRSGQDASFLGEKSHKVFGNVLELGNDFFRGVSMTALAD